MFGDTKAEDARQVSENWEKIKLREKGGNRTVLSGVPAALPALIKAFRIQEKAANVGFDWENPADVWDKVREEMGEVEQAVMSADKADIEAEFGDLIFAVVNAARLYGVNADTALEHTNAKFMRRFAHIEETAAAQGRSVADLSLDEMEAAWQDAKKSE